MDYNNYERVQHSILVSPIPGFVAVFVKVFGKVVVDGRFPDSFNRSLKAFETTTFSLHFLIVNFVNSEALIT